MEATLTEGVGMYARGIFLLFLFALGAPFFFPPDVLGKEETARLVFTKTPRLPKDSTVHVVREGEWLYGILRREYGQAMPRLSLVRRYNPHIKDLNKIYPGQRLILPAKADQPPATETPGLGLTETSKGPSWEDRMAVLKELLGRMNAVVNRQGTHYLPLPDVGQVVVDCRLVPMVHFDDGTIVFIDTNRRLPDHLKELVEKTWPSYRFVVPAENESVLDTLMKCVNATKNFSMKARRAPCTIGEKPAVRMTASALITKKDPKEEKTPLQVVRIIESEEERLPGPVFHYLKGRGTTVSEMVGDKVLPVPNPVPPASGPSRPDRLMGSESREILKDLLHRLGYETKKDVDVGVFDMARDGFNISIRADLFIAKGADRLIVVSRRLPAQFSSILKARKTQVVTITGGEPPDRAIVKVLKALGIPHEEGPYSFPVSKKGADAARVVFPVIRIAPEGGRPLFLVDFDLPPELYRALAGDTDFQLLRYR